MGIICTQNVDASNVLVMVQAHGSNDADWSEPLVLKCCYAALLCWAVIVL